MRDHGPEVREGVGRDDRAHARQIPFDERADEVRAPLRALAVRSRQVGAGESAAQPEALPVGRLHLRKIEAGQLVEGDSASEGFRPLAQKIRRRASEDQKPRPTGRTIRQHPQDREELGPVLDLIEHHQAAKRLEGQGRFVQLPEVGRVLQVEPGGRTAPLAHELAGKRRFPDLACAEQRDDRILPQQTSEIAKMSLAWNRLHH